MNALVYVGRGTTGTWDIYARDPKDLHLGTIGEDGDGRFSIHPDSDVLAGVEPGPHADLEAAMSAVARIIGGRCEKWAP